MQEKEFHHSNQQKVIKRHINPLKPRVLRHISVMFQDMIKQIYSVIVLYLGLVKFQGAVVLLQNNYKIRGWKGPLNAM